MLQDAEYEWKIMNFARGRKKLDGLLIAFVMSMAFLAISYTRIIGDAASPKLGRGVMDAVLLQPVMGTQLGVELAQFVGTLILIHALLAMASWALALATLLAWPDSRNSQRSLTVFWLVLLVVWVLGANSFWFPGSSLGGAHASLVRTEFAGVSIFEVISFSLALAIAGVLLIAAARYVRILGRSKAVWGGGILCLSLGVALPSLDVFGRGDNQGADPGRPNVILLGVDSLRTDYVQTGEDRSTSAITRFLSDSVQFSNAYTPLARTFPAWVSLISGKHPHTTGAFVNLLPRELIDAGQTLPSLLSEAGYRTVYAIDEVRFSNLDLSYGFDEMLAPPMGAADFLLGFFADTPFANVLVNTSLGEWLFPYSHANRAAAKTYDPDTFIDRIDRHLDFDGPTLFAAHFTLAHWPYTWAGSPGVPGSSDGSPLAKTDITRLKYEQAIARVDQQFERLMEVLERKGALENAIVIVFSDHGESLGERPEIDVLDEQMELPIKMGSQYGHGTHIFSKDQYNVVFGIRSYGNALVDAGQSRSVPVSLEDLTPTVLDLLDIESHSVFDGRSLVPYMMDEALSIEPRIRFLETEFNPPGISAEGMPPVSAILDVAEIYRVDPDTDRVLIRTGYVDDMLWKRQYAAELDGHILAAVPSESASEQHLVYYDAEHEGFRSLASEPSPASGRYPHDLWLAMEERFALVRDRRVVPPPPSVDTD